MIFVLLAGTAYGQSNLPACAKTNIFSRLWNGYSNCVGEVNFNGISKYIGEFKEGKFNGQGTFTEAKGNSYVGEWKEGKRHGQGAQTFANGDKYVGEYKENKFNGQGTYTEAKGNSYVGEWKDGKRQGQGTLILADGRVWLGEWANDQAHGQLIKYSLDGSIQQSGIYKDGVLVTLQYVDLSSFNKIGKSSIVPVGSDTQSNLPACQGLDFTLWNDCVGLFESPNNYKYFGGWIFGEFHGFGTITYISRFNGGRKYIGEWKNGKQNGKGKYFDENGTLLLDGIWVYGDFLGNGNPTPA